MKKTVMDDVVSFLCKENKNKKVSPGEYREAIKNLAKYVAHEKQDRDPYTYEKYSFMAELNKDANKLLERDLV